MHRGEYKRRGGGRNENKAKKTIGLDLCKAIHLLPPSPSFSAVPLCRTRFRYTINHAIRQEGQVHNSIAGVLVNIKVLTVLKFLLLDVKRIED